MAILEERFKGAQSFSLQSSTGAHLKTGLPRTLSFTDALSIVIGMIIGGGIFLVPNLIARNLGAAAPIVGLWIFAGVVSFFGALGCAELGAAMPSTGGQYVFLREAYGPLGGFLCGWTNFLVARSAQAAWLAVIFTMYVSYFHAFSPAASKLVSLGALALFTFINYRGVSLGALVQKCFTSAKVAGILVIIGGAFLLGHPHAAAAPVPHGASLSSYGVALIACLLAYDGWVQMSFVAGEIRDPARNIFRALAIGTAAVIAIYVLANVAYLRVLSVPEIAASERVGADAAERIFGPAGGTLVTIVILASIIGTLNGCFLTSPRIFFAQAQDGLFFRRFGEVHPRYRTPGFAILAQGVWSAVLIVTGSYETLVDYAMFAIWGLYVFMIGGVIVLRRTRPDLPRPYKMWGYPVTPAIFLAVAIGFLGNMLITRPGPALAGLGLMLTGLPVYYLWRKFGGVKAG